MKVPFREKDNIEREAEILISSYERKYGAVDSLHTPIDLITEHHLRLTIDVQELDADVFGCIDIHNKAISINQSLDPYNYRNMEGRYNFTLGHEVGHYVLHKDLVTPIMPSLFDDNIIDKPSGILCRKSEYKEPIEWQADYFSGCLLMARKKILQLLSNKYGRGIRLSTDKLVAIVNSDFNMKTSVMMQRGGLGHDSILEWWATDLAKDFKVSPPAMVIRLKNLGFIAENENHKSFAV